MAVDLGLVHRVKAILVKGVITDDVVGRPTELRFFYKEEEKDNYVVYFPNFNLTARDPGKIRTCCIGGVKFLPICGSCK